MFMGKNFVQIAPKDASFLRGNRLHRSHMRNMEIGPTARWCTLDPHIY